MTPENKSTSVRRSSRLFLTSSGVNSDYKIKLRLSKVKELHKRIENQVCCAKFCLKEMNVILGFICPTKAQK